MAPVDVAIVGGGLVGASLVLALAQRGRSVALIEAAPPPAGAPRWDERCIAVNAASVAILQGLGAWPGIAPDASPITSTHISERGRFGIARFTAAEAGLPALGYNVPLRALSDALWQAATATPAQLLCPARAARIVPADEHVDIVLDGGGELQARLVIGADGAESALRAQLGIGAQRRDYRQSAIVTAVRAPRAHGGCAYERFTPDGPIALLPKPDSDCSLVWTLPTERAAALLAASDAEFLAQAQDAFGERLGRFKALGRRNAHPLVQVMADRLTGPRALLAGNAAQSLHPVAAQGFNLGLRDVAAVAAFLGDATDPGAPELLRRYADQRGPDRRRIAGFTDGLIRAFSNRVPGLRELRHLGLLALDLAPPIKAAVMWQNLGYAPGIPRSGA